MLIVNKKKIFPTVFRCEDVTSPFMEKFGPRTKISFSPLFSPVLHKSNYFLRLKIKSQNSYSPTFILFY